MSKRLAFTTVPIIIFTLNAVQPQKEGGEILCDPGWCVHKSDVQNKEDDKTHSRGRSGNGNGNGGGGERRSAGWERGRGRGRGRNGDGGGDP